MNYNTILSCCSEHSIMCHHVTGTLEVSCNDYHSISYVDLKYFQTSTHHAAVTDVSSGTGVVWSFAIALDLLTPLPSTLTLLPSPFRLTLTQLLPFFLACLLGWVW